MKSGWRENVKAWKRESVNTWHLWKYDNVKTWKQGNLNISKSFTCESVFLLRCFIWLGYQNGSLATLRSCKWYRMKSGRRENFKPWKRENLKPWKRETVKTWKFEHGQIWCLQILFCLGLFICSAIQKGELWKFEIM